MKLFPIFSIFTHALATPMQWSNYRGARGGLANLKDLAAPAKHVLRGFKGALKGLKRPLKLQDFINLSIRHCNMSF